MSSNQQSDAVGRRTVTRAAAWAIPAVSLVAAAPAFATSVLPPSTWYYTGISAGTASGNVGAYDINGRNAEAQPAALPAGTTIVITPSAGVTVGSLPVIAGSGAGIVPGPNGTWTLTVGGNTSTFAVTYRLTGPVGGTVSFVATVPGLLPPTETQTTQIV